MLEGSLTSRVTSYHWKRASFARSDSKVQCSEADLFTRFIRFACIPTLGFLRVSVSSHSLFLYLWRHAVTSVDHTFWAWGSFTLEGHSFPRRRLPSEALGRFLLELQSFQVFSFVKDLRNSGGLCKQFPAILRLFQRRRISLVQYLRNPRVMI